MGKAGRDQRTQESKARRRVLEKPRVCDGGDSAELCSLLMAERWRPGRALGGQDDINVWSHSEEGGGVSLK